MGRDKVEQRTSDFSQNLLDKLPVAVCSLDSAGCFTYLNTAACQLLGYPDESALLGVNFSAVIDAERTPLPADTVTERLVAATDEPLCADTTLWLQPRVGAALPVEVEVAALRSAETAAGEVAVTLRECRTVQDITEQRARERFQQQLVAILDSTSDLVTLHGSDGSLIYINEALRARFGLQQLPSCPSVEEAIRRRHPPWAADLLLNEGLPTARREGLWQGQTAFLDADGQEIPASQVIIGHRDSSGEVVQLSTIIRDISDLKRTQQEAVESEQRFRLIAEHTRDVFWLRSEQKALYVNPAYERIWGQTREHFYANPNSFLESVHPEDRKEVETAINQAIAAGEEINIRYRIVRPDGDVRWMEARSSPFKISGTEETLRAGVARDVTDEALAMRRLEQLVAILDNTSDIVALHGEDGTLLYLNAAGRAKAGIDNQAVDGMLGIADDGSMPPLSLEEAISRFHPPWAADLLLNEGLPTVRREGLWQGETAILKADGTQAPTSQVLIGHRNSYGELTYISTILRDISDQKKAQQEVAESERRFRLIAENIRDAFWLRTDAQTLYVNPAYERIWGQPVESFYANPKAFLESIHPEDRYGVEKALDQAISEREEFNALFRIIRSNSEVRWIQMHSLPVPGRESEGMRAGIARDVTEREQALIQLREANRTKSEFLNAVSHDLRTPLNAIIGFTDLLADSELDAHQREQVKLCQAAGRTLLGLIDTLLDLSRLKAGRMTLQKEAFLLRKFLAERMPMLSQQAEDKGLNLQCSVDNGLPDRLQGDTTRLSQVLFNLVSNAIKFTDSGYVRVHFSRYDSKRLQVSVQDNGPGIPDEFQERIFEPFDRGTDAIKHLQGSGLGLAISRQLVNLMGGEIWLHSTPGQGSTFFFTAELPEDESEPAVDPAQTAPESANGAPADRENVAGTRVLVAEDEPTNILLIQALLERCGAEATVAENGQEALDIWQQAEQEFDLILLDMQMPILDGAQTVKSLREAEVAQNRVYTPVAMLSAHASTEVREQCLQSGADTYMTKPVRLDSLTDLLSWAKRRQR